MRRLKIEKDQKLSFTLKFFSLGFCREKNFNVKVNFFTLVLPRQGKKAGLPIHVSANPQQKIST
jgi:hypothetical protein